MATVNFEMNIHFIATNLDISLQHLHVNACSSATGSSSTDIYRSGNNWQWSFVGSQWDDFHDRCIQPHPEKWNQYQHQIEHW